MDFVANFKGEHQVALNQFADLTNEEYQRLYLGMSKFTYIKLTATGVLDQPRSLSTPSNSLKDLADPLPDAFNWNDKGNYLWKIGFLMCSQEPLPQWRTKDNADPAG